MKARALTCTQLTTLPCLFWYSAVLNCNLILNSALAKTSPPAILKTNIQFSSLRSSFTDRRICYTCQIISFLVFIFGIFKCLFGIFFYSEFYNRISHLFSVCECVRVWCVFAWIRAVFFVDTENASALIIIILSTRSVVITVHSENLRNVML